MLHRGKRPGDIHSGKWNGLGGKLEPGETPEECVVREVREESGLKISRPRFRGVLTFPGFDGENDWLVFVYTARRFSGKLGRTPEGLLRWIPDRDVASLPLWEGDRIFLRWLKGKRFFSAKFTYKKGRLRGARVRFYP